MFNFIEIAIAFGCGIFAASIGGLAAFIMCGVLVVANMPELAFGGYFGPHVSFAAGVGAAAYAGTKDMVGGSDIATPLIKFNDSRVLLVGGLFGIGGLIVQKLLASIATPTDTVALTVGLSGIAARFLFGNKKLFTAYSLPSVNVIISLCLLGLGVGLISGYAAIVTKNVVLGFGIAAITLVLPLFMKVGPATHHVALPAAVAAAATGDVWIAGVFGVLGALLGDFIGQTMNSGDTHVDPPAIVIALLTTVVVLFMK